MRLTALLLSLLSLCCPLRAQVIAMETVDTAFLSQIETLMRYEEEREKREEVMRIVRDYEQKMLKREMSFEKNGIFPLFRGLIASWTDHSFIKHPAAFEAKSDKCNWSDYAVGGAPLVANWALRAAGVKSRSKTERMLTANAMAMAISFGVSKTLKETIRESRPDMSDNHSFPSGHASFAFASASILSREYGYISPWVTVGSYATATGTQLLRIEHNKHWMNDLYMGAGIGMVSTNLAYFLTDKIFGSKAINAPSVRRRDMMRLLKFEVYPSGVSFVSGSEMGSRTMRVGDGELKTGTSLSVGFDAAWYWTSNVAGELMGRATTAQVKMYNKPTLFSGEVMEMYHLDAALKGSMPVSMGRHLGARAFVGARFIDGVSLTDGCEVYSIKSEAKPEVGAGISVEMLESDNYVAGFTFDYFHTFSHYMPNRYSLCSVWKILF